MAECAWEATWSHIEDFKSPVEVARSFDVAMRAIFAYQVLQNEFDSENDSEEAELAELDNCPGWQHLIEDEEEE